MSAVVGMIGHVEGVECVRVVKAAVGHLVIGVEVVADHVSVSGGGGGEVVGGDGAVEGVKVAAEGGGVWDGVAWGVFGQGAMVAAEGGADIADAMPHVVSEILQRDRVGVVCDFGGNPDYGLGVGVLGVELVSGVGAEVAAGGVDGVNGDGEFGKVTVEGGNVGDGVAGVARGGGGRGWWVGGVGGACGEQQEQGGGRRGCHVVGVGLVGGAGVAAEGVADVLDGLPGEVSAVVGMI
ncbi:MAG: hypothetical protein OXR07_02240, partial [Nitrospira sp.]|nr:hypothetical protein [Nitrospira sp.]